MDRKELYQSIGWHLLNDVRPSEYLNSVYDASVFKEHPFNMLRRMRQTEQSPKYHPEGNVWNHTMLVVDEAAAVKSKSNDRTVFMWATLLHDIGKPVTTRRRRDRITAYDHDRKGAKLAEEFLSAFSKDGKFIEKVTGLVRYHMHIFYVVRQLPFADIQSMKRETDVNEIALLGLCDRLGRTKLNRPEEEKNIEKFLQMVGDE